MLELTDLLTVRDPGDFLKEVLAKAVDEGRIEVLLEGKGLPEDYQDYAREMVDILKGEKRN